MIESRKEEDLRKPIEEKQQKELWLLFILLITQLEKIPVQIHYDIDNQIVKEPQFYKKEIEKITANWTTQNREKWRDIMAAAINSTTTLAENQFKQDTGINNQSVPQLFKSMYLEAAASSLNNVIFEIALGFSFIVDSIMVWNWQRSLVDDYQANLIRKSNDKVEFISTNTVIKVYTNSLMEMSLRAGIDGYWWQTMEDDKVRHTHAENNGKYFPWNKPSPITGKPGDEPNCRCLCRLKKDG